MSDDSHVIDDLAELNHLHDVASWARDDQVCRW